MSGAPPVLTTHRSFRLGPVLRPGASAPYRAIVIDAGEPHQLRDDLMTGRAAPLAGTGPGGLPGRALLNLVHVTDLQLADVESPARFEFLNQYFADPRYAEIVPVQRPQEALTAHAIEATIRTLNRLAGPVTGASPELAVTTGDAIDNAQWNELRAFLALLDGGLVTMRTGSPSPRSGSPRYDGVQSLRWPDGQFWKPDGPGPDGPDLFRREFGFPHHPGLLDQAIREFRAGGLDFPWLSCYGNHEALIQGVGVITSELAGALTGASKPVQLPDGFDHDLALQLFTERPHVFLAGPSRRIRPDPGRKHVTKKDFVEAHFGPGARPAGHGFTAANRASQTAYYVHDTVTVRLIALDTSCAGGGSAGCLDHDQACWLHDRLIEVHAEYRDRGGSVIRTGNDDRLVMVFSHHGVDTLTNRRCSPGPGGMPQLARSDVLALLHRFGNVVLWLNGHTHTNAVRPRPNPADPARGFWEVTTSAVVDWPCQTRMVELLAAADTLAIVCTMVDHDAGLPQDRSLVAARGTAPGDPAPALAALHRELAGNMPFLGADSSRAGLATDRNVILQLAAPFPLGRLPG